MNSETSCIAKGRLNITVGGKKVWRLIAKVWQNIKKDNTEKTEQETDLERERWLIDQLFCLILGQETPFP